MGLRCSDVPETPRDASAASVTASALIELSTLVDDGQVYFDYAEKLLKSLSSDVYLAKVGTNQGFILMHLQVHCSSVLKLIHLSIMPIITIWRL